MLAGAVINILGEYDGNDSAKATKITIKLDRFVPKLTARIFRKHLNKNQEGFTLVELIVVVVMIDFITQVQSHLFQHQYEGLLKKTKLKGRR